MFHLGYHGNVCHFEFYQHAKSFHTLRWIFLRCFMKFDERNKKKIKSPLFYFHGNCGKVCATDSDFFGLSHSTGCGCCSYRVSSISVHSYDVSWNLIFISMTTAVKFVLPIPILIFSLSRSNRCVSDRKHYCKNLWSLEWI